MSVDIKNMENFVAVMGIYLNNFNFNDRSLGLGVSGAASGASELYKR